MNRKYFFFYYIFLFFALLFPGDADHLVFNRLAIAPNDAEMFSIYNPTDNQEDLSSYYITDGINPDSNTERLSQIVNEAKETVLKNLT